MGDNNLNPLEELRSLDAQVEQISDLAGLKPIFYRLDEIARANTSDFEVQLVVGDIKQHLVNRGTKLKQMAETVPMPPAYPTGSGAAAPPPLGTPPPMMAAPPPMSPPPMGPPPMSAPPKLMSSGQFGSTGQTSQPPPMGPPPPMPGGYPPLPTSETRGAGSGANFPTPPTGYTGQPPMMQPPPQGPPQGGPPRPGSWKNAMFLGLTFGLIIAIGVGGFLFYRARKNRTPGAGTTVAVDIATTPPGASIRINNEDKCKSNCQVMLEPGDYQMVAFLDGYEAAASSLTVTAGKPAQVNLTLEPQAQAVRVLSDLQQGKVKFDDQPEMDLQEGQFTLDKVAPGMHTISVTSANGQASVSFTLANASLPEVNAPMTARNLLAVAVSSFGTKAKVATSSGPLKLAVNGTPQADVGPAGVELSGYQPGVSELVLGEANDQRSIKENFTPAPALTVFLKSDQNIGTLIVTTGTENGVKVFINNKEYQRVTQRGEVRVRTLGNVNVRVAKDGFDASPAQTAEVKKGGEVRLMFTLKPAAQFSTLQIRGGTPGTDVYIDGRQVGAVAADGNFINNSVLPGNHVIELRQATFTTKRLERDFKAGQPIVIQGPDAALTSERPVTPPPPAVEPKKPEAPPPPKPPPPQAPKVYTMSDFDNPNAWKQTDGVWTHRGAAYLTFKPLGKGTYNFTVHMLRGGSIFRGGRVRWFVDFTNTNNMAEFEMDDKNFWAKDVVNGKTTERAKTEHKQGEKTFVLQVEVSADRVVHKMQIGNQWYSLDSWDQPGRDFTDGKFGFLIQGDDEIGVSDFRFTAAK